MQNEIKHVGVLGMRWGRRKGRSLSEDHKAVSSLRKKKAYELSNDEIRKVNTRRQLEKQFKDLNPSTIDKGKKAVNDVLKGVGWVVATAGTLALS